MDTSSLEMSVSIYPPTKWHIPLEYKLEINTTMYIKVANDRHFYLRILREILLSGKGTRFRSLVIPMESVLT
jgi:hypothetical protein